MLTIEIEISDDGVIRVGAVPEEAETPEHEALEAPGLQEVASIEEALQIVQDLYANMGQVEEAVEAEPEDAMTDEQYWKESAKGRPPATATGGM